MSTGAVAGVVIAVLVAVAAAGFASQDGLPFGSSFQKNQRKPARKSMYEFSGTEDESELKTWVDNFNFVALYLHLIQMTNISPTSD
jgi:hypothetical protein